MNFRTKQQPDSSWISEGAWPNLLTVLEVQLEFWSWQMWSNECCRTKGRCTSNKANKVAAVDYFNITSSLQMKSSIHWLQLTAETICYKRAFKVEKINLRTVVEGVSKAHFFLGCYLRGTGECHCLSTLNKGWWSSFNWPLEGGQLTQLFFIVISSQPLLY